MRAYPAPLGGVAGVRHARRIRLPPLFGFLQFEFIFSARGWLVHGSGLDIDDAFVECYVEQVVELVVARITANGRLHPSSGERRKDP
jgi:hypothetical protein